MKQTLIHRLSLMLVVFAVAVGAATGQSSEDYKVYDAVIRHMFRDGVTRFDMNAKIESIVIREQTVSDKDSWEQVKIRIPEVTDELIAAYEFARKSEYKLQAKFDTPYKYQLITETQLTEIFPKTSQSERVWEQWANFHKVFPKSAGYNSFSRVAYTKSGNEALVYFVNWCGQLCGTGTFVYVINGKNGWEVKRTGPMWIS